MKKKKHLFGVNEKADCVNKTFAVVVPAYVVSVSSSSNFHRTMLTRNSVTDLLNRNTFIRM